MIAGVTCVLTTINCEIFAGKMIPFFLATFIIIVIQAVMIRAMAVRQREAVGGYINFRNIFRAILITTVIFCVINSVYYNVYIYFIDPTFKMRNNDAYLNYAVQVNFTQQKLDEIGKKFNEDRKLGFGIGRELLSLLEEIGFYSIFGLICAVVIKREHTHEVKKR